MREKMEEMIVEAHKTGYGPGLCPPLEAMLLAVADAVDAKSGLAPADSSAIEATLADVRLESAETSKRLNEIGNSIEAQIGEFKAALAELKAAGAPKPTEPVAEPAPLSPDSPEYGQGANLPAAEPEHKIGA